MWTLAFRAPVRARQQFATSAGNGIGLIMYRGVIEDVFLALPYAVQKVLLARMDVSRVESRGLRRKLLRKRTSQLADVCRAIDFRQTICVDQARGVSVECEGIRLSCEGTNRYFKVVGSQPGNEGAEHAAVLRHYGIAPHRVIDIGANFGEISLYFAKNFRDCRVLAIEASPANIKILHNNLAMQPDLSERVTIEEVAVGDRTGCVEISSNLGSENSIIAGVKSSSGREPVGLRSVPMRRLGDVVGTSEFKRPDFIKVDVEGAEPLVGEDLGDLKAKAMVIEYSYKNTPFAYAELTRTLLSAGYVTRTKEHEDIDVLEFIDKNCRNESEWHSGFICSNIWFIRNT